MAPAATITISEFQDTLSRYPALIQDLSKASKPGVATLAELDTFRYVDAPSRFSRKAGGRALELPDVQKLVEWKLRHGTFRPSLPKQVASNSDEAIRGATSAAFSHYAANPENIAQTLDLLTKPLKGIGPATGSLILAIHDPENVVFFSDEAYRWLVKGGERAKISYSISEFEQLYAKAKELQDALQVSPIDIEKVAYVTIKENEPATDVKPNQPSGRPRGRPRKPDSEKKIKKSPVPGRGRGRPKGSTKVPPKITTGEPKKRGRPIGSTKGSKRKAVEGEGVQDPEGKRVKA